MFLLILFVLIIFGFYSSKHVFGSIFNHVNVINVWWGGNICLSLYNDRLYKVNDNIYDILLLGLFSFNVAHLFFINRKVAKPNKERFFLPSKYLNNAIIAVICFLIPYVYSNFKLLIFGATFMDIRTAFFIDNMYSGFMLYFLLYLILPISFLLLILSVNRPKDSCRNKSTVLLSFILTIILFLVNGGRQSLFDFFVFIALANVYIFNGYFKSYVNTYVRFNYVFMLIFVLLLYIMTSFRSTNDSTFLDSIQSYYLGPFRYLDAMLNDTLYTQNLWNLGLGKYSFGSFDLVLNALGRIFFNIQNTPATPEINSLIQPTEIMISPSDKINAFPTMYYFFIRDFGFSGVLIFPFLLGSIISYLYFKSIKDNRFFPLYIYMIYTLIMGTMIWPLSNAYCFYFLVYSMVYVYIVKKVDLV